MSLALLIANIALVLVTIVLAVTTLAYTKATKRLRELSALEFLQQYEEIITARHGQSIATVCEEMLGSEDTSRQEKALSGYNGLFRKVLDDVHKDFGRYDPIKFKFHQ